MDKKAEQIMNKGQKQERYIDNIGMVNLTLNWFSVAKRSSVIPVLMFEFLPLAHGLTDVARGLITMKYD